MGEPRLFRCIDFETTGIPAQNKHQSVCEIGWCDVVVGGDGTVTIGKPEGRLCNPGRPIPPEARGIHHISDRMVAGLPMAGEFFPLLTHGADALVAHQADHEREFFAGEGMPWICTWKAALRRWVDAPDHKLQTLRYLLGFELDDELAWPPHRAGPDAYVCAHLLADLLADTSIDDLVKWSSGPALLTTCYLKKYRGVRWSMVPRDYLEWVVGNIKDDRDVRATAKYYLAGGKPLPGRQASEKPDQPDQPAEAEHADQAGP